TLLDSKIWPDRVFID
nr:nitric oxide synthase, NOSNoc {N-terminal} {EC 4.14.23.-} [Nocardia, NRRL 5646, Peptide Partial, 15 aa] [Nocardia]